MVFGWFKSERRERRRKVRLDRQYLEARARRLLKNYLSADQGRKPLFYRAVEDASIQCHQSVTSEIEDAQIAEATSRAAMQVVLQREERSAIEKADDQTAVTDRWRFQLAITASYLTGFFAATRVGSDPRVTAPANSACAALNSRNAPFV